jgi:hypothetical protein
MRGDFNGRNLSCQQKADIRVFFLTSFFYRRASFLRSFPRASCYNFASAAKKSNGSSLTMEVLMYTTINFKTKKALKEALLKGEKVSVFQPGPFEKEIIPGKKIFLEGPHYPAPHSWYGEAVLDSEGFIKGVK